jgi:hypothetical protein
MDIWLLCALVSYAVAAAWMAPVFRCFSLRKQRKEQRETAGAFAVFCIAESTDIQDFCGRGAPLRREIRCKTAKTARSVLGKSLPETQMLIALPAEEGSGNWLHDGSASFETAALRPPQDEEAFDGIEKIAHPEEAAKQLSRRMHGGDPADRRFLYNLFPPGQREDHRTSSESRLWPLIRRIAGQVVADFKPCDLAFGPNVCSRPDRLGVVEARDADIDEPGIFGLAPRQWRPAFAAEMSHCLCRGAVGEWASRRQREFDESHGEPGDYRRTMCPLAHPAVTVERLDGRAGDAVACFATKAAAG